jgi:hypothetical protein
MVSVEDNASNKNMQKAAKAKKAEELFLMFKIGKFSKAYDVVGALEVK